MLNFDERMGPPTNVVYPVFEVPAWWRAAGLGIFIHWGIYSVPAFAERPDRWACERDAYAHHAYAEWYANTIRLPESMAARVHRERYGEAKYEHLLDRWCAERFDADALVADALRWGMGYVVLVTKHHDGCCLWDTATTDLTTVGRGPRRDLVAEVAGACRRVGIPFGAYFSGALDWHVDGQPPITSNAELFTHRRNDETFARFCAAQVDEVVERFAPDILWNDIDWPDSGKGTEDFGLAAVLRRYQRRVPHGVVNDRWGAPVQGFLTREYSDDIPQARAWEATRSLGASFGYNAEESVTDLLTPTQLNQLYERTRAHGGNLLLNVGLTSAGEIPAAHRAILDGWATTRSARV